jgi:hypothetical protein
VYTHYGVTTLDTLIERINTKINNNNPNYDISYLKRLGGVLEDIKGKYGNILTVAATLPIKELSGDIRQGKIDERIPKYFEDIVKSITKSLRYYLISVEYYNGYPVLIVGEPDGLNFGGKMKTIANIYEVKSTDLIKYQSKKDEDLIKKILHIIREISDQLIIYQYLLEKTTEFSLIGKIERINLYGIIYFYSEDIGSLYGAKRIIRHNLNRIMRDAYKYNAYNFILKEEGTIYIDNRKIYYFKISFRVKYNQKIVETHLKNLNELIKSLKPVDNRGL